ncbi:MAG: L-seryl-tRNA(Sec) selenium transferase [Candidatus Coatesbacteria bacterium]|nr:MAG: L-seryl-tRNA(Sec) selenium transferase [Candidatus Coatesbacteria bacterium]
MLLRRIVNATGVVLHTGAGRAPFGPAVVDRLRELLEGYTNLEVDLDSGERGQRNALIAGPLRELTGAEEALVVNNNAGAVLLALRALGEGRPAAASRGQLVEIGGAFRLPNVMAAGGVELRPVGTVNVTRLADFRRALDDGASLIVLAHRSNFYFRGRYEEPRPEEVVELAASYGRPVLYDLGSGLLRTSLYPDLVSAEEPSVENLLDAGVDVVCFSGDKLLGGPQAGIVVGKAAAVGKMRGDSLYRALRVGKETYALLAAVLECYLGEEEALAAVPVYRLLKRSEAELDALAGEVATYFTGAGVAGLEVATERATSYVGGGTLPYVQLPTAAVALRHARLSPHALSAALRRLTPPVLARATGEAVLVDVRSVLEEDLPALRQAAAALAAEVGAGD